MEWVGTGGGGGGICIYEINKILLPFGKLLASKKRLAQVVGIICIIQRSGTEWKVFSAGDRVFRYINEIKKSTYMLRWIASSSQRIYIRCIYIQCVKFGKI